MGFVPHRFFEDVWLSLEDITVSLLGLQYYRLRVVLF